MCWSCDCVETDFQFWILQTLPKHFEKLLQTLPPNLFPSILCQHRQGVDRQNPVLAVLAGKFLLNHHQQLRPAALSRRQLMFGQNTDELGERVANCPLGFGYEAGQTARLEGCSVGRAEF